MGGVDGDEDVNVCDALGESDLGMRSVLHADGGLGCGCGCGCGCARG